MNLGSIGPFQHQVLLGLQLRQSRTRRGFNRQLERDR